MAPQTDPTHIICHPHRALSPSPVEKFSIPPPQLVLDKGAERERKKKMRALRLAAARKAARDKAMDRLPGVVQAAFGLLDKYNDIVRRVQFGAADAVTEER